MQAPIWLTNAGDLGVIPEEEYYEFFFDSYNPGGGNLTYSLIAGNLPDGLEIKPNGTMIGIPVGRVAGVPAAVSRVTTSTFTIRITNQDLLVADRTFSLTVAGILPQIIIPTNPNLGTYLDGTYFEVDLNTIEPNRYFNSTFSILDGEFPLGLTLNPTTGVIKGYIEPLFTGQSAENTGFDNSPFDTLGFDFSGVSTSKNYQFTIKADNGVTIDTQTYQINVIAVSALTADSDIITADAQGLITADILGPLHRPVILTPSGDLDSIRQNTNAVIKIEGKDYDGDGISYALASGSLPPGLSLNTATGWITGTVPSGQLGYVEYNFSIYVYKTLDTDYRSSNYTFTITVLGQINDIAEWQTESDLGILYTGQVSELLVTATTPSDRSLNYRLEDSTGTLPYGLSLTTTGLITGRVSFSTFTLDSGTTTFDSSDTTFDRTFTFTIAAYDSGNYVYSTKEFTVRVVNLDDRPYENLYIRVMPDRDQRQIYDSIINSSDIFPEEYLYRADDPWFGKNQLRRSLFLSGLSPELASAYISAMTYNHYWKNINFGQIKTARALNSNSETAYEVVYVELIDNATNQQGQSPNLSITLPPNSANISTVYPNSFTNMAQRISDGVGYENRSVLPSWMTSRQTDGTVLGFTRALVLCYTKPGKSSEIAYRVRQVQDQFKSIGFTLDRYEWDNSLSDTFNKSANSFVNNNFVTSTGLITANTSSNLVIGVSPTVIGTGTITGVTGNATIIGTDSLFSTELRIGRPLYRTDTNVLIGNISSIRSATRLTLDNPLTTNISGVGYSSIVGATEFTSELHVGDTLLVNSNVRLGTIKTINSDGNLILYANALANVSSVSFQHTYRDTFQPPGEGDKYLKYPQVGVIS